MDDYVSSLEAFAAAGWDVGSAIEAATVLAAEACGVARSREASTRANALTCWQSAATPWPALTTSGGSS